MSIQNPDSEKFSEVSERGLASFSVLKKTESQTWGRNGVKKKLSPRVLGGTKSGWHNVWVAKCLGGKMSGGPMSDAQCWVAHCPVVRWSENLFDYTTVKQQDRSLLDFHTRSVVGHKILSNARRVQP